MARLDVDRYGVPQYAGEPELYDADDEGAWDLWHGREGQDSMQAATAVHLRAGLSGTAYEAVRKLEHAKTKTKDSEGKPSQTGFEELLEGPKRFQSLCEACQGKRAFPAGVLLAKCLEATPRDDAAIHHSQKTGLSAID